LPTCRPAESAAVTAASVTTTRTIWQMRQSAPTAQRLPDDSMSISIPTAPPATATRKTDPKGPTMTSRPLSPAPTTGAAKASAVALSIAKWTGLTLLWFVQYLVYLPFVYLPVRAFKAAVKLGFIGILLLCLPVIGWAILLLWLILRHPAPEQPAKRGALKPWGLK